MSTKFASVSEEYAKNDKLKTEDVKALQKWVEKQPHLPKITELQLIIFLHSCYYSMEATKKTIDNFFTVRTHYPEIFGCRNEMASFIKEMCSLCLYTPFPKLTPEGYSIIYLKLLDSLPEHYIHADHIKAFDMAAMLYLMQEGTKNGQLLLMDCDGLGLGHLIRMKLVFVKASLYFVQEALPYRLKGIHILNTQPFVDKFVAAVKPFMNKELWDLVNFHQPNSDSLYKFVPKDCLPKELGGTNGNFAQLTDSLQKNLLDNVDYFEEESKQLVDESRRPGKAKNAETLFGVDGSFKKLEID